MDKLAEPTLNYEDDHMWVESRMKTIMYVQTYLWSELAPDRKWKLTTHNNLDGDLIPVAFVKRHPDGQFTAHIGTFEEPKYSDLVSLTFHNLSAAKRWVRNQVSEVQG